MNANNILKDLIAKCKSREELNGVAFIYGNKSTYAPSPVTSFVMCCSVGKTNFSVKEESLSFQLELCLLAPLGAGGKELSEMCFKAANALKESDVNSLIESIEISSVKHDKTLSALYSEMNLRIKENAVSDGEVFTLSLFADDKEVKNVLSFKAEHSSSVVRKGELLQGNTYTLSEKDVYKIVLKTLSPMTFDMECTLRLHASGTELVYGGCVAEKTFSTIDGGKLVYEYTLTAQSFDGIWEKGEEDGQF